MFNNGDKVVYTGANGDEDMADYGVRVGMTGEVVSFDGAHYICLFPGSDFDGKWFFASSQLQLVERSFRRWDMADGALCE